MPAKSLSVRSLASDTIPVISVSEIGVAIALSFARAAAAMVNVLLDSPVAVRVERRPQRPRRRLPRG